MALCIDLPVEIEVSLRTHFGDLDQAAKEACLVEFYRQDRLTHVERSVWIAIQRMSCSIAMVLATTCLLKKLHDRLLRFQRKAD